MEDQTQEIIVRHNFHNSQTTEHVFHLRKIFSPESILHLEMNLHRAKCSLIISPTVL